MSYTHCARCEAELSLEYQAEVEAQIAAIAKDTRHVINVRPVCEACDVALTKEANREALKRRYADAEHAGDIPHDLSARRTPLKAIVDQNRSVWATLARDAEVIRGRKCVWLHGKGGTGKSSLCRYLLCKIFEAGGTVAAIGAGEINQRLTAYDPCPETEIRRLSRVRGLLIDDIDALNVAWSGRGVAVLRRILDARHEAGRPTFVTSNAAPLVVCDMFAKATDISNAQTMLERLNPRVTAHMVGKSYRVEHMGSQILPAPQPLPGQGTTNDPKAA